MTFPLSSRSTQISNPSRFPVIDFEPLLDAIEAAALLRIHPNTLRMEARLGEIPGRHIGKYWRFRTSDLNDWVRRQETAAGLLKLLHPHRTPDELSEQEIRPIIELALEMRKRVTDQLAKVLPTEFSHVDYSYELRISEPR